MSQHPAARQQHNAPMEIQQGTPIAILWAMAEAVPEADEDGMGSILDAILGAESVHQLDSPFNAEGLAEMAGTAIEIRKAKRLPSDFQEGVGFFLVLEGVRLEDGEKFVVTTGSAAVVAQVVKAYALGQIPFRVIPRIAQRATKKGYYPMHLEVIDAQPLPEAFDVSAEDDPLGYQG